jgi:glycine cleavage system H protein
LEELQEALVALEKDFTKMYKGNLEKLTRRQFLKNSGLIIGGAALSHVALAAACGTPQTATTPSTTAASSINTTRTTTSSTAVTSGTSIATLTNTTTIPGDVYVPPTERPPLKETPGCTTFVAFDRLYSIEHIWLKELGNNRAVLGMTDKMQALMGGAWHMITLPEVGTIYPANSSFGQIEGFKMTVDLLSPVATKVIQINDELKANLALLNTDPFVNGWMMYVELTKPEEVKTLISPQEYMMLQAK